MAHRMETTQSLPTVTSEYDPSNQAWIVTTTTTVVQTIYLDRSYVEEIPQLPVITTPAPSLEVVNLNSDESEVRAIFSHLSATSDSSSSHIGE